MSEYKGVLIVGELSDGSLAPITSELLGIGRKLADDLGQELSAVLIGSGVTDIAGEAILFGADKVYVIDNPSLKDYQSEYYTAALESLCKQVMPDILLLGQTPTGRDLAPGLAFGLDTGATLDCVQLSIDQDTKLLQQTKPIYGGNAFAIYVTGESRPQIATIRPRTMPPSAKDGSRKGEIIAFDPGLDTSLLKTRLLGKIKDEVPGPKLEEAEVVVCGGRGMGSAEAFAQLQELSRILDGGVAATRPPCDAGWVPSYYQIGLTGKLISPTLYIGVALSGSSQHQAGMASSKNIVAINKDPEANIFGIAHFGVVGDYRKVLPSFIERCKELVSE